MNTMNTVDALKECNRTASLTTRGEEQDKCSKFRGQWVWWKSLWWWDFWAAAPHSTFEAAKNGCYKQPQTELICLRNKASETKTEQRRVYKNHCWKKNHLRGCWRVALINRNSGASFQVYTIHLLDSQPDEELHVEQPKP
jgi:hypothetical protein